LSRTLPRLAPARTEIERRPDGSFVLRSPEPLSEPAPTMGTWLARWAREAPDRIALAERPPAGSGWRTLSWADLHTRARAVAQGLLERGLSLERPVMVLSGNSIDHACLMLGAYLAGVPIVPVSEAYSLRSQDHAQLQRIAELATPGLVFAESATRFGAALDALGGSFETVSSEPTGAITPLHELLRTRPGSALDDAAVGPSTVAKILMTSGSTGRPKGVLNTHRMLTANQAAIAQMWPFVEDTPPVLVDWLPWSHTFGSNHNLGLVLRNGGTLYIDGGRPAPGLFDRTIANLREIAPTIQFNVPAGYTMLVQALEADRELCATFFSQLQGIFYAAAALPQDTWERLDRVAERTLGHRVWLTTAWGSTETSPLVTSAHFASEDAANIGIPAPGTELRFVPSDDRYELRVRGPSVTPGYHRQPEATAAAFDDEGFYRIGDAGRRVDEAEPSRGIRFEGRVAEDFKLASGTWVRAGTLRTQTLSASRGLLAHGVVAGHDSDVVVLLGWLSAEPARALAPDARTMAELVRHPQIHAALRERLAVPASTGVSRRIARVLLLQTPPELDRGEITDKGYINAAAVLANRADDVARCLRGEGPDVVSIR